MNVATSNTTVAQAASANTSSQNTSKTSVQKSDKSFDEEMKTVSKNEDSEKDSKAQEKTDTKVKNEKTDNQKTVQNNEAKENNIEDAEIITDLSGEINFTDFKYGTKSQSILSQNIKNLIDTKDLISSISMAQPVEYDSINMSYDDANFFANLVQHTDMSMKDIASNIQDNLLQNTQNVQKSVQVSSVLMEKLAESINTNRPFRIDFDKDVSVIIKVNRDGSIAANFIPGDKAVEEYLRNNISTLRQRFDDEELSYSQLSYSSSNNREQKRKKENDHE